MSGTVRMRVTMELLSDAIFGSGFSIPGGEDIAVCRDGQGYPYLKGTTLKGLLRESLENLIAWTGGSEADVDAILGVSGWDGTAEDRRLHLTALTLESPPTDPEECYDLRTFTSLENGTVKEKTLRTASCIRRGLHFSGELVCAEQDADLLRDALAGIKWVGTMRSRGFGSVRVRGEDLAERGPDRKPVRGRCIHYRLHTETPVLVTDLSRSMENSYATRGYIPGSAVRGMVMSALSGGDPAWFEAHKTALLSDATQFQDAVPICGDLPVLPSVKGFYETKEEAELESVLIDGTFAPGKKRAKLGSFCALDGDTIRYWSAGTDGAMRIKRNVGKKEDTEPFQTSYLSAGQDFSGYILLEDESLSEKISGVFADTVWLGADRFEGFGKCSVTCLESAEAPDWAAAYGCGRQEDVGTVLYLLAVSPLTMVNGLGELCGIDAAALAEKLGVESLEIRYCSTSLAEFGGYNRTWKCRAPAVRMYDRGSVFKLVCKTAPALERVQAIQREGLGIRRAEGYGQVLFLRRELLEGVTRKEPVRAELDQKAAQTAKLRDAKYEWVMENAGRVYRNGLSKSQIGTIQSLCEQACANGGNADALLAHLDKNLHDRGARHGSRFTEIDGLIREVLSGQLPDALKVLSSTQQRLDLLCLLFDYSRKGSGKEES